MVHVSTGNALDVVYDYEDGIQVLRGLVRHGSSEVILLREPEGLVDVLTKIIAECKASKEKANGAESNHRHAETN